MNRKMRQQNKAKRQLQAQEQVSKKHIANLTTISLVIVMALVIWLAFSYKASLNKDDLKTAQISTTSPLTPFSAIPSPDVNTDFTDPKIVKEKVLDLYLTHPDPNCQRDMTAWLKSGQVIIVVESNLHGDMGTRIMIDSDTGEEVVTVVAPTDFLTSTKTIREGDIRLEKFTGLYHEYIHIQNHFNGQYPLNKRLKTLPIEEQAKYIWGTEFVAYRSQWQFLKQHHGEHLMLLPSEIAAKGELKAVADEVLKNIKKYDLPNIDKLIPYWEKYYHTEIIKQGG